MGARVSSRASPSQLAVRFALRLPKTQRKKSAALSMERSTLLRDNPEPMADYEQQHIPFRERRFKNPKLRRGIFLIPSLFTVGNLLCGYYASIAALVGGKEDFDHAAKAIGIAILFDSLDGRIARLVGANTEFGVQFDSLADVVSFGIAPAILAYAWGFRYGLGSPGQSPQLGEFAWIACLTFL